jgi:hypothetical protein
MPKRFFLPLALPTIFLLTGGSARADDSPQDVAAARSFGMEGLVLAENGRCTEAIPKLERAEKLHHAPTTAERLAECLIDSGKIVAGTEILQRLVREPLGSNPSPAFVAAVERGRTVLGRALARIATLHVAVVAPPETKYVLTLDGQPISDALANADFPIGAGSHTLRATAPGSLPATATVRLGEGEKGRVELKLEKDPDWRPPAEVSTRSSPVDNSMKPPMYAAFGVGALGVVVGGVTGAVAASHASAAESACPRKACVRGSEGESSLDSARTFGTVSTIAFVVGGVGIAAGAVFYILSRQPRTDRAHGIVVTPAIGLGSAGLEGSF